MDFLFQKICDIFPAYKLNNKFRKKIFYIFFSLLKIFLKGPFLLNFGNFKIFAYPQKGDYTRFLLSRSEVPDPRERNIIIQNLKNKNNVFIDCGANAGFYSLDVSTKVNNVKVYAFEPSIKELNFLKKNLNVNKIENTEIIELAVGDQVGKAIFNDTRQEGQSNSSGGGFITETPVLPDKNYEVEIITLDEFFKNKSFSNNTDFFIKVDLEGYDLKAINGAKNFILKYDCNVIFEFSKMIMKQENYSINDFQFFLNNGFKIFDMYGKTITPKTLEDYINELDESHDTCGNYILSKKNLNFDF